MDKDRRKKNYRKEHGQSMVELAVSIVVLLILLAGVVDIGRIAFYYIAMRDSAQEGASYGSIFPNDNYEIIERAKAGVVDDTRVRVVLKIKKTSSTYECSSDETCAQFVDTSGINKVSVGDIVEVTVSDPAFPITMPILGTFLGRQSIELETTIQDVVIRVPQLTPTPSSP